MLPELFCIMMVAFSEENKNRFSHLLALLSKAKHRLDYPTVHFPESQELSRQYYLKMIELALKFPSEKSLMSAFNSANSFMCNCKGRNRWFYETFKEVEIMLEREEGENIREMESNLKIRAMKVKQREGKKLQEAISFLFDIYRSNKKKSITVCTSKSNDFALIA